MKLIGHGDNEIVERVIPSPSEARERIKGLKQVAITGRIARECIDIAYGFFTPLQGFMNKADVEAVSEKMTLANGTLWSIPIVFDIAGEEIREKGIKKGDTSEYTFWNVVEDHWIGAAFCQKRVPPWWGVALGIGAVRPSWPAPRN